MFYTNQPLEGPALLRQLAQRTSLHDISLMYDLARAMPPPAGGAPLPVLSHVTRLSAWAHNSLGPFLRQGVLPALRSLLLEPVPRDPLELLMLEPQAALQHSADNVLVDLVSSNLGIEDLKVVESDSLTNAGLGALLGLTRLKTLCLRDCKPAVPGMLSALGVRVLLQHPGLEQLEVVGCSSISDSMTAEDVDRACRRPWLIYWQRSSAAALGVMSP